MKRVHFTTDYDHRWPSGATTAFKAGMRLPVKDEVAEAAIGKGKAELDERLRKVEKTDGA